MDDVVGLGPISRCDVAPGGGALSLAERPGGPNAEHLTGAVLALAGVCARVPMLISVRDLGWLSVSAT